MKMDSPLRLNAEKFVIMKRGAEDKREKCEKVMLTTLTTVTYVVLASCPIIRLRM